MCHIKTMQCSNENTRRLQASVQAKAQSPLMIAACNRSEAGKAALNKQGRGHPLPASELLRSVADAGNRDG